MEEKLIFVKKSNSFQSSTNCILSSALSFCRKTPGNKKKSYSVSKMKKILAISIVLFCIAGCGKKESPETTISGYITVKGSEEALSMIMEEAYTFMDLYTNAKILALGGGSDAGLSSIFVDSARIAVSTRPLTKEENTQATAAGFKVNEFKICKDGVAIVTNPHNSLQRLTIFQISDIFSGKIKNWSEVDGIDLPIKVGIWSENSGTYKWFQDSVLKGKEYSKFVWQFDNTESIVKFIEKEKGGIGFISMSRLYSSWSPLIEDTRIKALEIALEQKGEFVSPDEATVHSGKYPLVRYIYLYTSKEPKGLDAGFISFITSSEGQKIIAGTGFVPITVPVKYKENESSVGRDSLPAVGRFATLRMTI
ncbi:MAG: phosphate ABC transporter substrate-binding protein [bacterium]